MPTSILIVEDERIIAKGIEKRLKGMGYAVAGAAASGEEAIQKTVDLRPDLILMDINLGGGMDGIEAAQVIRAQLAVPVVYLTAHSDDATLQRAKLTGPFGYVLKPYEDRDLQTAIELGLYRHQMETRLKENEQWLAATLGSIGDGVIATDDLGRVRFLNALAERLTGWTQAEAFGKTIGEVFNLLEEKSRQPMRNPVFAALEQGQSVAMAPNAILIARDGTERPIDDSAAPIRNVHGQVSGAVMVFRDITERRRLEDHLRQAQKMEAIGRLAGGIAHDFNNIMTIIIGTGELLLQAGMDEAETERFLREIVGAGQRAAGLTKQILAFSRKQILLPCVLNLNTVVRDMASMVQRLVGSNIELRLEADPALGAVRADPTQLGQVVLNLAANARDAMAAAGGRLVLATANADLDAAALRDHPDVRPGRYAMLAVGDTGSGMSAEVLRQVFEPFFTTKEVGQGTGLGLSTVYGIVKQSGGHVEVASEVGVGTTVRVYLPRVEEVATPSAAEPRAVETGTETVLVVEDEDSVRNMTRIVLEQVGYRVLTAAHGLDAVSLVEATAEPIHLLITDLVMPHLAGRQVAERLTALRPGLRVLYMSGFTEELGVPEAAGAHFLHKPFTLAELTRKVREVLDQG